MQGNLGFMASHAANSMGVMSSVPEQQRLVQGRFVTTTKFYNAGILFIFFKAKKIFFFIQGLQKILKQDCNA